jgi:hypothetical protein
LHVLELFHLPDREVRTCLDWGCLLQEFLGIASRRWLILYEVNTAGMGDTQTEKIKQDFVVGFFITVNGSLS